MNFRLSYESHTVLSDINHHFVYASGSPDRVEVRIRSEAVHAISCSATGYRIPLADALLVFNDLEQRRVPSSSPDPRAWQGCLDGGGLIRENVRFPVELLPSGFKTSGNKRGAGSRTT